METKTSMYDFMFRRFEQKKNTAALGFLYKKFTFKRLKEEADKAASAFAAYGLEKGDTVTLALPNIPTAVSAFYGANKIGLTVNLVHPLAPYSQLKETMVKTNSKLLLAIDIVLDKYFNEVTADGFKVVCCKAEDWLKFPANAVVALFGKKRCKNITKHENLIFAKKFFSGKVTAVKEDFAWDETRIIMHSGGTTSLPKSIMLSGLNFNAVASATIEVIGKDRPVNGEAMIAVLPMFHCFGLGVTFHTALSYGYQAALIPKYSPKAIVKVMRKNKNVTMISGVPTMFKGMVGQKGFDGKHLSRMEFAFCGGDKLSPALKARFDEAMIKHGSPCRLDEGYGLTETSGVIAVNRRGNRRDGSVGKALGDCIVKAFDGELCVSGDVVMKGYLEAGESVFFEHEGKKFVKTGDIGTVDGDGYIFMKTRIKRMIKVSGVNVYPAEAENVILQIAGVNECVVVGRPHPHKGAEAVAFVVADSALENEIKKQCAIHLNKWTAPKQIVFLDKIPLTNLGKPDYKVLEQKAEK